MLYLPLYPHYTFLEILQMPPKICKKNCGIAAFMP